MVKISKTVLNFMMNHAFYGINNGVPLNPEIAHGALMRIVTFSAQNSDCMSSVIIHSNSWLIKFVLHGLKEKWLLFPIRCFFVLSPNQKYLFDSRENDFWPPLWIDCFGYPLVFGSRCTKLGGGKQTIFRVSLANWTAFHVCKNYMHCLTTEVVIKVLESGVRILTGSIDYNRPSCILLSAIFSR